MTHYNRIDRDPLLPDSGAAIEGASQFASYEIDLADAPNARVAPFVPEESFGARLRRKRLAKGLSQAELAAAVRVSVPAVCGWEKDRTRPRSYRLQALCDLLDMSDADLLDNGLRPVKPDMITHSRELIARAVGTTVDKVRIIIEL